MIPDSDKTILKYLKGEYVLLLGILIVAAFLRLKGLNFQSLWGDELFSLYHSSPDFTIFRILGVSRWDPHPPLFLLMLHLWIKTFGFNEFNARFFIALIGIISILPVYFLGKEIWNKNSGIIASFLVSVNSYHLYYSQEVRPYILLFLFTLLSYLFFIKNLKGRNRKKSFYYVLFTVLMLYIHYYGLVILLSQIIYLFFHLIFDKKVERFKTIKGYLFSGFLIFLLYSPMLYFVLKMLNRKEHWIKVRPKSDFFLALFQTFFGNEPFLVILFSGLLLVILYKCMKDWGAAGKPEEILKTITFPVLFSWIIFSLFIPYFWSIMVVPMVSFKHAICTFGAFVMLIAIALEMVPQLHFRMILLFSILLFSLTNIFIHKNYYKNQTKQQWRESVSHIIKSTASAEKRLNILVFSDEIRYSQCYFQLMKSNIKVQEPTLLNIKNMVRARPADSVIIHLIDWEEQLINDNRFIKVISDYFDLVEKKKFISLTNLLYISEGKKLKALREIFRIS